MLLISLLLTSALLAIPIDRHMCQWISVAFRAFGIETSADPSEWFGMTSTTKVQILGAAISKEASLLQARWAWS